jgi:hypothetical protein
LGDAWVIDAAFTHPYGEALPRLYSWPAVVGVAARLSGRVEEKRRILAHRGQCTLCELGEALVDQIGVQRHRPGAARLDRVGVRCEAQDPNGTSGTLSGLYVPSAKLRKLANSGPGVRAEPRNPSAAGGPLEDGPGLCLGGLECA